MTATGGRAVPSVESGYLTQPEMRELVATALDLGWRLVEYEADVASKPANLAPLSLEETNWQPMGFRFAQMVPVDPFVIDQVLSVRFGAREPIAAPWVAAFEAQLNALGGTAGFLSADAPASWPMTEHADAFLLSTDNDLIDAK